MKEMTIVGVQQLIKDVVQGAEMWAIKQAKAQTKKMSGALKGAKAAELLSQEIEKNDTLLPLIGQYMDLPIVDMIQGSPLYKSLIKQAVERGYYLVEQADEWLDSRLSAIDGVPERNQESDLPDPLQTADGREIEPASRAGPLLPNGAPANPQGNDPGAGTPPDFEVDSKGDEDVRRAGIPQSEIDAAKKASEKAGMNEDGFVEPVKPKEVKAIEAKVTK